MRPGDGDADIVPLGEFAEVRLGRQRSPDRAAGPNMRPYMRAANVGWDGLRLDDIKEMDFSPAEQETYRLQEGDILVGEASGSRDEVGKSALWRGEIEDACFQNTLIRVRVDRRRASPEYVRAHLLHDARRGALADASRGVGIHHLGREAMATWPVRLPPLPDQHRIVAHLDACFARTKRAKAALDEVPALLDRLRQSILAAAFRGDLTADWRAEHPDVEPASELLKRIRVERRRRWEEAELAKMVAKGKPPKDDRWKAKYVEPEPVDESELPELPEGWCWASVDEVTTFVTSGSRGWSEFYSDEGPLFLRVANVSRTSVDIDLADIQRVSPPANAEGERTRVETGDLLVTITADLGRVAVIPDGLETAYVSQHVGLVRPVVADLARMWSQFLAGPIGQNLLLARNRGATKAGLGLDDLRRTAVPIVPMDESAVLVDRTDELLDRASHLQAECDAAERLRGDLERAVLGSSFSSTHRKSSVGIEGVR